MNRKGFTLIELLIVIAIIGILSSISLIVVQKAKQRAYTAAATADLRDMARAAQYYYYDYGAYPDDVSRGMPNELKQYLKGEKWPQATWPGSCFDWDYWSAESLTDEPKEDIYQISIRFCDLGDTDGESCRFPNQSWAEDFDYHSAAYFCIQGPCRSHQVKPVDHPGYCLNCS